MGQALLVYHSRVQKEFLTPLKAFLEVDVKNVMVRRWQGSSDVLIAGVISTVARHVFS